MAVARRTLDRFTSMKSSGSALPPHARTEPTATALPDAELVAIMATWPSGFLADKMLWAIGTESGRWQGVAPS